MKIGVILEEKLASSYQHNESNTNFLHFKVRQFKRLRLMFNFYQIMHNFMDPI